MLGEKLGDALVRLSLSPELANDILVRVPALNVAVFLVSAQQFLESSHPWIASLPLFEIIRVQFLNLRDSRNSKPQA